MAALTQNLEVFANALMPALMWQDLLGGDDPLMKAFKPGYINADKVQYDQYESPYGLLPLRGLNGTPPVLQMPGFRRYQFDPGYFGGQTELLESELTSSVQPGTLNSPLDVSDRLGTLYLYFATMVASRMRKTVADGLATGTVTIVDAQGNKWVYTIPGYRTYTPGTGWGANPATATPITDLLTQKANLQKGTSTKFGGSSKLLMNSISLAEYFRTAQVQSTYRAKYGSSFVGLDGGVDLPGINALHQGFDLPPIEVYDYGYFPTLADAKNRVYGNWQFIVPTRTVLWLGDRKGQQLGQMQLTRHAGKVETKGAQSYPQVNAPNENEADFAEGLYVRTHYQNRMPHKYDLEVGYNGSLVLWYDDSACGITTG